jgi:hypothetical protein
MTRAPIVPAKVPAKPIDPSDSQASAASRLAQRMEREGLTARPSPFDAERALLIRHSGTCTLGAGTVPMALLREAAEAGLLHRDGLGRYRPATTQASKVTSAGSVRTIAHETRRDPDGNLIPVAVNLRESPLLWLRRHRDAHGKALIDDDAFAAGERLRADITRAALLPGVTMDWSRFGSSGVTGFGQRQDPHDTAIAARQRVHAAMDVLGHELAGFLIDTCGFLISLQDAERQRGWPARSGKLAMRIALRQLARHYGIDTKQPAHAALEGWRASDARSDMSRWL